MMTVRYYGRKISKIVAACVLATVGTALMTASKTSLLYLWTLRSTTPLSQWYAALLLVVLVPEVTCVLRTLWGSSLLVSGATRLWPSLPTVLLGLITAVMESAAMTFFTLGVASSLPPYAVLPLMHTLLLLQMMLNQWKPIKHRMQTADLGGGEAEEDEEDTVGCRMLSGMAGSLGLCLVVLLSVMMALWGLAPTSTSLALLASLAALSLAWCRPVRRRVFCLDPPSGSSSSPRPSPPARQNMLLLLGVVRVVAVLGASLLTVWEGKGGEVGEVPRFLWTGLRQLSWGSVLVWGVGLHCLSTVAAYLTCRLGAYYSATRSAMLVPTALSTLTASSLFLLYCANVLRVDLGSGSGACSVGSPQLAVLIVAVVVWLVPFLTLRGSYFRPSRVLFCPEFESFFSLSYTGVCLDQNLFLDYNPSVTFGESRQPGALPSRVFICTTMYREADYEMEQLLRSLSTVSRSRKLRKANVYLESHLFLDNGADNLTLNEFALQLMSLVETCLAVTRDATVVHKTPYGIQIRCVLPGGMLLFLHLKDSSLVKAKKRWSQIMYMKYILDHRIKTTYNQNCYTDSEGVCLSIDASDDKQTGARKKREILLQIRSLLKGFKHRAQTTVGISVRSSSTREKEASEQSSDQGIDIGDEASFVSDTSSRKDQALMPRVSPSSSGGRFLTVPQCSSYGSLTSADLGQCKENPAYSSDEEEGRSLSTRRPEVSSALRGACPVLDSVPVRQGSALGPDVVEPAPIFTISPDLPERDVDCASIQLEVPQAPETLDKNTYILATDADMLFSDTAVLDLVSMCNEDLRLGAACGRTFPIGKKLNPIVWYQIFEYAKDFWMIKSAQNVIGSVMCCPGCFSLYRAQAIQDVLQPYSQPTARAWEVFTKDTGEDRWMCTLMMMWGWKLRYSTYAVNSTYCPDSLTEFIKQRRRWILSDLANSFLVFRSLLRLMRSNGCFSFMYAIYLVQLFGIVVFSPGTTVVMLTTRSVVLAALLHPAQVHLLVFGLVYLLYFPAMYMLLPIYAICNIIDQSWGTRDNTKPKVPKFVCFPRIRRKKRKKKRKSNKMPSPESCENLADEPGALSEQIQDLAREEGSFWRHVTASLIGRDANLGLGSEQLASSLRTLRNKAVVTGMVCNLLWILALSALYMLTYRDQDDGQVGAFGVFAGIMYAFSFLIQVVGMTVFRLQDVLHRLGKMIYGKEKPHYVQCAVQD
ncbi:uncharacterized protein LOC143277129 [Babylonia areolata]|uniref:uncharacterized protein LOC143277129 n=1 Tax=Babylonia areolata TaxID=304850 RepID=UPI003FD21EED